MADIDPAEGLEYLEDFHSLSRNDDTVDVVIPARNEERNIGRVISVLMLHPAIGKVIVAVDSDTADNTARVAVTAIEDMRLGWVIPEAGRGKGQCVRRGLEEVKTENVLFCDGDITGLTYDHVSLLLANAISNALEEPYMTIGVPEIPKNYPTERLFAWPWVSGQRCVPTALVRPLYLHGYLMEAQINQAAQHAHMPVHFEWLRGLHSSYYMSIKRIQEMERDRDWGKEHGVL